MNDIFVVVGVNFCVVKECVVVVVNFEYSSNVILFRFTCRAKKDIMYEKWA